MKRHEILEILNSIYADDRIAMCRECDILLPYDADTGIQCPSCFSDMEVYEDASHLLDALEDQSCEITHMVTGDEIERMLVVHIERYATFAERRQLLAACGW